MMSREALAAPLPQTGREQDPHGREQLQEDEWRLQKSQEEEQDRRGQIGKQQRALEGQHYGGEKQCDGVSSTKHMLAMRQLQENLESDQIHGDAAAALLQRYREKFEELQISFSNLRKERATLKEQHAALLEEHRSVEESLQRIIAEVEDLKSRESADASSTAFLAHFIAAALRCLLETAASGGTLRDVVRGLRSEMEALQMPSSSDPRLLSCYARLKKCDTGSETAATAAGEKQVDGSPRKQPRPKSPQQQKQQSPLGDGGGAPARQQKSSKQQQQQRQTAKETQEQQQPQATLSEDAAQAPAPQQRGGKQHLQHRMQPEQQQRQQEEQPKQPQQQQTEQPQHQTDQPLQRQEEEQQQEKKKEKEQSVANDETETEEESKALLQNGLPPDNQATSVRRRYTTPHGTKLDLPAFRISGLPEAARRRSATALGSGTVSLAAQFAVAARAPVPREEHTPMMLPELSQEQQQQENATAIKTSCTWPRPSYPCFSGGKSLPKVYADMAQEPQDPKEQQHRQQGRKEQQEQQKQETKEQQEQDGGQQQEELVHEDEAQQSRSTTQHAFVFGAEGTWTEEQGTDKRGSSKDGGATFPFLSRSTAPCFSVTSSNSSAAPAASPASPSVSSSFFLPPPAALPGSVGRRALSPHAAAAACATAGAAKKSASHWAWGAAGRRSAALETQQLQQQLAQLQLQLQRLELHLQQQQMLGTFTNEVCGEDGDAETADSVAATAAEERRVPAGWLRVPRRGGEQQPLRRKQQQEMNPTGMSSLLAATVARRCVGGRLNPSSSSSTYSSTEALDGSKGVRSLDLDSCSSCSSGAGFLRRRSRASSGNECSPAEVGRAAKTERQQVGKQQQLEQSSRRSSGLGGGQDLVQEQHQEGSHSSCTSEQLQPKALSGSSNNERRESVGGTIPSAFQHLAEQQKQQHYDPYHHDLWHRHHRLRAERVPVQPRPPQSGEKQQQESPAWGMQHPQWHRQPQHGRYGDIRGDESEEEAWRWGLIEPSPSRKGLSGSRSISVPSPTTMHSASHASAGALDTGGLLAVCRSILELEHKEKQEQREQLSAAQQSVSSQQQASAARLPLSLQQQPASPSSFSQPQQRSAAQLQECRVQERQLLAPREQQLRERQQETEEAEKTRVLQEVLQRQQEALQQQQITAQLQKALLRQQEALKAAGATGVAGALPTGTEGDTSGKEDAAGFPEAAAAEIVAFHTKSRQQQLEEVWFRVTQLQAQILANTENPRLLQQLMLAPANSGTAAARTTFDPVRGYAVPSAPL